MRSTRTRGARRPHGDVGVVAAQQSVALLAGVQIPYVSPAIVNQSKSPLL